MAVVAWAGLEDGNPVAGHEYLADYNDGVPERGLKQHRFTEIADLIEKHL